MGYCPQFNPLLELLNGYETLRLYANLRGVPSNAVEPLIKSVINVVDLQEHASKPCGQYRQVFLECFSFQQLLANLHWHVIDMKT